MTSTSTAVSGPTAWASWRMRSWGPVAIAPVGAGHVLGDSGRPMRAQAAAMAGDPFAAMKDLGCPGGDARLDLLADQLVRHAVVMLGDLDVIIEADAAALPLAYS